MLTFPEADRLLRGLPACAGAERTALGQACGRIAAETVSAPGDLPRAPRSAMDGYAVHAADASAGRTALTCAGAIHAGETGARMLVPGECIAVATGAVLPEGAGAVVPREFARAHGTSVLLLRSPTPGANVVQPGEEGRGGTALVPAGARLGARHIAALAAYGFDRVRVREPLRVAILATGDEVVEPGRALLPEQVYDSGSLALEAELRTLGTRLARFPTCPDREADLAARFGALLAGGAYDAIITTGGVSAGDRDLVPAAWERLGAQRRFWRVAAKPGRAIYVATAGPTWIFSLSGNPHAALASYYSLIRPALAALGGLRLDDRLQGRLHGDCEVRRERHRLLWAEPAAEPGAFQPVAGRSVLETLIRASALLLLPPGSASMPSGAAVDLVALDASSVPGGGR